MSWLYEHYLLLDGSGVPSAGLISTRTPGFVEQFFQTKSNSWQSILTHSINTNLKLCQ